MVLFNDTLLVKNAPSPDIVTPQDTSNRKKLAHNKYHFPYTLLYSAEPGDFIVVTHKHLHIVSSIGRGIFDTGARVNLGSGLGAGCLCLVFGKHMRSVVL